MPPPIEIESSRYASRHSSPCWPLYAEAPVGFVLGYNDLHWSEDTLFTKRAKDKLVAEILADGVVLCLDPDCDNCGTRDYLREPEVTVKTFKQHLQDLSPEEKAVWVDWGLENGVVSTETEWGF